MGSDHMYTLLMRRNYYIKRSYDWYHRRVWCQHLLCTEKKMSTSTVTRTASTSSDTSLGDWLEEEGVVVKDEETLTTELKTDSSLSPTVESVIVDPFETLIQDSLHKLITSLLTKFETEVLVVISVLAVLSLLFTSVRKRVLRLVGCGRRPLQQPPQEDNEVEEKEEEETIQL